MARKNRDLFEILGARRGGAAPQGIVKRVQEMVAPTKPAGRSRKRRPAPSPGLLLAAVGFGGLLIGFVGGRWSAASAPPAGGDLNASARPSPDDFGQRPGRFGPAERPVDPENLTESLSTSAWALVPFAVPDSVGGERAAFADAERLAGWLWDRGFSNVRLRPMQYGGQKCWVVVDYIDSPDDTAERERLIALEAPEFAPDFGAWLAKFPKPIQIKN